MSDKPIVIIGSPNDSKSVGDNSSNGGVKSQNLWAQLLIAHGYEAYFCSYDGSQVQWLIKHAPVVSIDTVRQWKAEGKPLKALTTWMWSDSLFSVFDHYYLYDQEIAFTSNYRFQRDLLEQHLKQGRILKLATHTRTIQAYYNAVYDIQPDLITEWSADYWIPCPERRIPNRIGFMDEGGKAYGVNALRDIGEMCRTEKIPVEFMKIGGSESEVLEQMQSCDLFLGFNEGKDDQWGEGCPRSPHEAMLTGCVVVAFDVIGNGQYLHDPATGRLVPRGRPDMMAERVVELLRDEPTKEALRARSFAFMDAQYRGEARWHDIAAFLDIAP